jgi:hypothetical protein
MSAIEFNRRMSDLCKDRDDSSVLRKGMRMIVAELGAGAPQYLEGLEAFLKRIGPTDSISLPKRDNEGVSL